jgi:hypothetical protein
MKMWSAIFGVAAVTVALTVPAAADYVRLGSVDVGYRADLDTAYTEFGGRLESLRLTASRSNITCRAVIVRFDNGERQNVFSGRLDEHRPVDVDLRGRARRVDSINFACRSDEFRGGRIFIAGEVGRFMDDWRHHRDWNRRWSGMFGGPGGPGPDRGPGGPGMDRDHGPRGPMGGADDRRGSDDVVRLGTMSFEGRNDRESNFTGWAGRHVDRIALRPLDGDARCMSIVATFDNGQKVKLADGRILERGRLTVYDLPGNQRNITKLYLRCRAVDGYHVTIEILARR